MDGFLEDFSGTKVEQVYSCRRGKIFVKKKNKCGREKACIESSIIIYCFKFKVKLAFSVKMAVFVPKKWPNIRISVASFRELLSDKYRTIKIHISSIYPCFS